MALVDTPRLDARALAETVGAARVPVLDALSVRATSKLPLDCSARRKEGRKKEKKELPSNARRSRRLEARYVTVQTGASHAGVSEPATAASAWAVDAPDGTANVMTSVLRITASAGGALGEDGGTVRAAMTAATDMEATADGETATVVVVATTAGANGGGEGGGGGKVGGGVEGRGEGGGGDNGGGEGGEGGGGFCCT